MRLVEAYIADAGTAVALDGGEQRDCAGQAIDLPDRSGRAAVFLGELACHEGHARFAAAFAFRAAVSIGVGRDDADTVQRGGAGVEVGNAGGSTVTHAVVIGEREDLADLAGQHFEGLRRIDDLTRRRSSERRNVENAQSRAFRIDEGLVDRIDTGRQTFLDAGDDRSREAGDGHRARIDYLAFLRTQGRGRQQACAERQREQCAAGSELFAKLATHVQVEGKRTQYAAAAWHCVSPDMGGRNCPEGRAARSEARCSGTFSLDALCGVPPTDDIFGLTLGQRNRGEARRAGLFAAPNAW